MRLHTPTSHYYKLGTYSHGAHTGRGLTHDSQQHEQSKVAQVFIFDKITFFWHNAKLLMSQSTTGLTEHSLRSLPMDKDLH
jgi:hypothetical protein